MQESADDTHPQGRSQHGCKELCNVQLSIVEHVKQRLLSRPTQKIVDPRSDTSDALFSTLGMDFQSEKLVPSCSKHTSARS